MSLPLKYKNLKLAFLAIFAFVFSFKAYTQIEVHSNMSSWGMMADGNFGMCHYVLIHNTNDVDVCNPQINLDLSAYPNLIGLDIQSLTGSGFNLSDVDTSPSGFSLTNLNGNVVDPSTTKCIAPDDKLFFRFTVYADPSVWGDGTIFNWTVTGQAVHPVSGLQTDSNTESTEPIYDSDIMLGGALQFYDHGIAMGTNDLVSPNQDGTYDISFRSTIANYGNFTDSGGPANAITYTDDLGAFYNNMPINAISVSSVGSGLLTPNISFNGGASVVGGMPVTPDDILVTGGTLIVNEEDYVEVTLNVGPIDLTQLDEVRFTTGRITALDGVGNTVEAETARGLDPRSGQALGPALACTNGFQMQFDYTADLNLSLDLISETAAASGVLDNLDLTYEATITADPGNDVNIYRLSAINEIASAFGSEFVTIVGTPTVINVDATSPPSENTGFDGATGSGHGSGVDLLNGNATNLLEPGQSFRIRYTVEVRNTIKPSSYQNTLNAIGDNSINMLIVSEASSNTHIASPSTSISDHDGDGLSDFEDLDDDNDGILDALENTCSRPNLVNGQNLSSTAAAIESSNLSVTAGMAYQFDSSGISTSGVATGIAVDGPFAGEEINILLTNPNFGGVMLNGQTAVYYSDFTYYAAESARNTGNLMDKLYVYYAIIDVNLNGTFESGIDENLGRVDPLNDGIIPAPNNSGALYFYYNDTVFSDNLASLSDYGLRLAYCDFDSDGIGNQFDLDSDGDGIPDNVEAQTTIGYIAPNTDDAATYLANDGVNSAYLGGLTPTNTDGTDNPDYLDTDSDNEGSDDTTEAGITLMGSDGDNDGLDDVTDATVGYTDVGGTIDNPLTAPVSLPDADTDANTGGDVDFRDATDDSTDSDNDGIPDHVDLDDDDDGILDSVECGDPPSYANQSFDLGIDPSVATATFGSEPHSYLFIEGDVPNWQTTASDNQIEIWESGHIGIDSYAGSYHAELNATEESALFQEYNSTPGEFTSITFAHRGRNGVDVMEVFQGPPGGPFTSLGQFSTGQSWEVYVTGFTVPAGQTVSQVRFEAISSSTGVIREGNLLDDIYIYEGCFDSDNDGIQNSLDLDSDNDGIFDAVEAGHGHALIGGRIDGASGVNGIPDLVETLPDSYRLNYTVAESLDDADPNRDYIDLDSDGDGIPDNVEAQTTAGYIPPNADDAATYLANNGCNSAYLGGLTPVNTDGTDNPDYLDTDSDNEGGDDTTEAGITLTANDNDNDGLDDATDATADYTDVGGTIDNPINAPIMLPDVDADASSGGDVDFRDAMDDSIDTDNDGTPDHVDLDDDNDGILDAVENVCSNLVTGQNLVSSTAAMENANLSITAGTAYIFDSSSVTTSGVLTGIAVDGPFAGEEINILMANANYGGVMLNGQTAVYNSDFTYFASESSRNIGNLSDKLYVYYAIVDVNLNGTYEGGIDENLGRVDPLNDGIIPPATTSGPLYLYFNDGGYPDNSATITDYGISLLYCDFDSDGVGNQFDLDADGDGIPDNVEAQTTVGYIAPNADDAATYLANNGVNSAYLGGLTPTNTDGTDNPDYLDLDSDNEGGDDTTEAGITLAGSDGDNDGLDDATDATADYTDVGGTIDNPLTAPVILPDLDNDANTGGDVNFRDATDDSTDTDNDTIPDHVDMDDDNDGIPDIEECLGENPSMLTYTVRSGMTGSNADYGISVTSTGFPIIGLGANGFGMEEDAPGHEFTFTEPVGRLSFSLGNVHPNNEVGDFQLTLLDGTIISNADFILTHAAAEDVYNFQAREDSGSPDYAIHLVKRVGAPYPAGIHYVDAGPGTGQSWGILVFEGYELNPIVRFSFTQLTGPNLGMHGGIAALLPVDCDTDGDGVLNRFDLDSDNDGILDAQESGHNQAHTNGILGGTVGLDGIPDLVQALPDDRAVNYSLAESTADTDTIYDFLDLDADGDGLPDNVEAQTTIGYIAPNADDAATYLANNGVNSAHLGGLTPTNTDGTDNPDYLDLDSDNEGGDDNTEAGITLAGSDDDNDGLDNATDATADYTDVGGTIDDPLSGAIILLDTDRDANSGGDVDFRDAQDDRLDTDNDGIADAIDFDDDNDGILDSEELNVIIGNTQPDCTGETILDFSTTPTLESGTDLQQGAVYRFPNVTAGTDALVTIAETFNASVADIDNNAAEVQAFRPRTAFDISNVGKEGYIEYRMQFVNSGGITPVTVPKFFININDTDGNVDYSEEVYVENPTHYIISNPTDLSVSYEFPWIVATGGTTEYTGAGNTNPQANFGINYENRSEIRFRAGITTIVPAVAASGREHNLDFRCTTNYINPEIYILDSDGDGYPNPIDLDSDNDGILDVVEAGHDQAHTLGRIPGPVGVDGIPDNVQVDPDGGVVNYAIAESTDDSDLLPNYVDLDADGDGIPDNAEAQTTIGYLAPSGTTDGNGVYTNYTSGLTPTNTDGVDSPDYLDTDSDNEGGDDTTEAGITLSGSDTDNDGLDDATDATADYTDVGGTIDNPLTAPVILPDTDNDATTGGDVDFRDATDDRPDNDNDGIDDDTDMDDDNDGIPDTEEDANNDGDNDHSTDPTDTDNDGVWDYIDLDADNDGIPDNVEAQTTIGYIAPNGVVNANGFDTAYPTGIIPTNTDGTDNPDYLDLDSDNEGGDDTTEAGITLSGSDTDNDGLDDATDATADYTDVGGTIDNPLTAPVILPDEDNDATTGGDVDFRDAIDDTPVDLDSDDDGILDSFEDLNTDGDNDPSTNPTNSDGDIYPDYLDIDSDNDGIPDNVEAQTTAGYIPPSLQDVNGNGVDDAYENGTNIGLIPVNTDEADLPDYLDTDSDNDNVPDNIEGNDFNQDGIPDAVLVASDKDNDGLDDSFEGTEQIDIDVNDEIDNPLTDLPDTDGDGESDYRDFDDDGDGINTSDEDINLDGDYSNDDSDNDGIPDYLDPDPVIEYEDVEVFNVITPNGDGSHDFLMITGLENRPDNNIKIFNRWGILVYETQSYNIVSNRFDGTSQARATYRAGDRLPTGTYFYLFNYVDIDGSNKSLNGHLYIN